MVCQLEERMIDCDGAYKKYDINSLKDFKYWKHFFENGIESGDYTEVKVEKPLYTTLKKKYFADKWYINKKQELWEFEYPNFPAQGFIRCFENREKYIEQGVEFLIGDRDIHIIGEAR